MTISLSIEFTTVNCGECGGSYALNSKYHDTKRENGGSWNCPYCRSGWGFCSSPLEDAKNALLQAQGILQRERAGHDQTRAELRTRTQQRNGQKAAKTRIQKRIASGICPCCNRSFVHLARHMKGKHPDYAKAKEE